MDSQYRAIRARLKSMAPKRAVAYIRSFELPPEEEHLLIACDVQRKSYVEAARECSISPEAVKRRRRRAYAKIVDQLNHV